LSKKGGIRSAHFDVHQVLTPDDPLSYVLRLDIVEPLFNYRVSYFIRDFQDLIDKHVLIFPLHRVLRECVDSHIIKLNFIPEILQDVKALLL
jgi:hypothetical protein